MNDLVFDALKVIVTACAALIAGYVIPWIKQRIGQERIDDAVRWAKMAVLYAQQVLWDETGKAKKAMVKEMLSGYCNDNGIKITDEQMEILIESAVKEMKMSTADAH